MRIGILRPVAGFSFSMDVYADGLISGLKAIEPNWEIAEFAPSLSKDLNNPILTGMGKYYQRYWHYPRQLKREKVDLFHVIDHSDGHLLYWLKKLPQSKVITCHDLINLTQPKTFKGRSLLPIVSMASWNYAVRGMRYAESIIAVSNHTAKDITKYLDIEARSITTIPNAVSAEFKPLPSQQIRELRKAMNLNDDDFCMLNVGSNNLRKNVSSILKAIAILRMQNRAVYFWKAGTDFDSSQKSFIAEHNLSAWVSYLGKPDQKQLRQIYNAADALVSPSTYEGFGLTILEAMACGTPVITSNVTSLPEVAGDAAILLESTDAETIVDAIIRLQSSPSERQALIERGLARSQEFTWAKTAKQVIQVYQQALSNT